MPDRLQQIIDRLGDYSLVQVAVEVTALWLIVYVLYRFIRGTRAAGALKGLLVIAVVATLALRVAGDALFPRLSVVYEAFVGIAAIALIVTFQPELRRALIRLGETPLFRQQQTDVPKVVDSVVNAAGFLSKNKFGAIMAIERSTGLRDFAERGQRVDGEVSAAMLNSIFWPSAPMHDMGVVIQGDRIAAASVQFPLVDAADMPEQHLGTRHRAAVGLSRQTDAIVIVVSEETGAISLAENGRLERRLTPEALRQELQSRLAPSATTSVDDDDQTRAAEREIAAASEEADLLERPANDEQQRGAGRPAPEAERA